MRIRILPYRQGSQSARELARALRLMRIRLRESRFRPRRSDLIINWGHSTGNGLNHDRWLNRPPSVQTASNKLLTFEALSNEIIPPYTTDIEVARNALRNGDTRRIFCRTILNGHSGNGIIVARTPEEVVQAPLYVWGIPKRTEYRVHVFQGQVIDYAEKRARHGASELENWNSDVRSYDNGWIFARNNVELPTEVTEVSIRAIQELGLDFGAVDICIERDTNTPYVLEVNTSPALTGTTLENYTRTFSNYLQTME